MKKTLLTAFAGLTLTFGFAQTATNWTVNDCSGNSHTLFDELDAGKVVVMSWTMPCGSCIGPISTAANTCVNMANPNVVFYLCDDYGNSSCSTVNNWAATNSIPTNATFSNAAIKMTDYGTNGMPKTVVLGGTSHTVYYNVNGTVSQSALQTAINNALSAGTGIVENNSASMGLNALPNPVSTATKITYALSHSADVTLEVMNVLGEKINTISLGNQSAGTKEYELNLEKFAAGIYFVELKADTASETIKLTVTK